MFGGLLTVIQELKVKNIIIGKQFENSNNLQRFLEIIKNKNIKIMVAEAGQRINIEKEIYFDILWPESLNEIKENSINNNSLVCKLNYKNFSILFTGDIEEKAEQAIILKYSNTNILESTILKVAHHGSKSSSINKFLDLVKPKITLIGVREKNKYGHPSKIILERLKRLNSNTYKTSENGEITIKVKNNKNYKIRTECD